MLHPMPHHVKSVAVNPEEIRSELVLIHDLLRGAVALDGVFDAKAIMRDLVTDAANVAGQLLAQLDGVAALGGGR